MKSLIASLVILPLVVCFTIFSSLYISKSMDKINSAIYDIDANENSSENVYEIAQTAEDHFKYRKSFLALLLNDRDVDEIEMLFEDLKSAAESESQHDIVKAKRRLISKLEQMKRLCAFNIDSVF